MTIALAETDDAIAACFPVMVQLRPHLAAGDFVSRVRRMQGEGYHLAARHDAAGTVHACAGFRVMEMLHADGRVLYVDDLVTDAAARSCGHGEALLAWLTAQARAAGCRRLDLDSGVQRHDAHRFYLRQRMAIVSHHFSLRLG